MHEATSSPIQADADCKQSAKGHGTPDHRKTGIFNGQDIKKLASEGKIHTEMGAVQPSQIQPASLDARLGKTLNKLHTSFLPGADTTVADCLKNYTSYKITMDEDDGAVLEVNCTYLLPLMENLALPFDVSATANPKSSTGRLNVFVRLVCDYAEAFDTVNAGYKGPLYLEITPHTFPIRVRPKSRLTQLRFQRGTSLTHDNSLEELTKNTRLFEDNVKVGRGLILSANLRPAHRGAPLAYRAKRYAREVLDVDKRDAYAPFHFWDPITSLSDQALILDPGEFYILASQEFVCVPPNLAAEMVAFDPSMGEFRAHYAGFFDPGFGYDNRTKRHNNSRAVFEICSRQVPFALRHGQAIGRLTYHRLTHAATNLYDQSSGAHYQGQGLKLSSHFQQTS